MATQLRSTRQLSIAGETLDWTEIDPYIWELAFPGGPVIGQVVEIPAHGRSKQAWKRQDTQQQYHSVIVACSDLLTAYYRKQAHAPTPPTPEPPPDPAPRLALVPAPERPIGVPDSWLPRARAAVAYNVPVRTIEQWIADGTIDHVTAGTAVYVPPPPAETTPEPVVTQAAPTPEPAGRWVLAAEAARLLGVTSTTVLEHMKQGKLQGRKVSLPGKRWQWEVLLTSVPEPSPVAEQPALLPEPEPVAELPAPIDTTAWLSTKQAAAAYGVSPSTIKNWVAAGKVTFQYVPGPAANGHVLKIAPPPEQSAPAPTGPLPEPVALSEFAGPTIEVQHTPPSDDHLLEPEPPPTLDMRLLAAMQRIGYLEAQLEHWQAEAGLYKQEIARLIEQHYPAPDGDPDLAGPIAREPKPRRWFPFNW